MNTRRHVVSEIKLSLAVMLSKNLSLENIRLIILKQNMYSPKKFQETLAIINSELNYRTMYKAIVMRFVVSKSFIRYSETHRCRYSYFVLKY